MKGFVKSTTSALDNDIWNGANARSAFWKMNKIGIVVFAGIALWDQCTEGDNMNTIRKINFQENNNILMAYLKFVKLYAK